MASEESINISLSVGKVKPVVRNRGRRAATTRGNSTARPMKEGRTEKHELQRLRQQAYRARNPNANREAVARSRAKNPSKDRAARLRYRNKLVQRTYFSKEEEGDTTDDDDEEDIQVVPAPVPVASPAPLVMLPHCVACSVCIAAGKRVHALPGAANDSGVLFEDPWYAENGFSTNAVTIRWEKLTQ